ncbi:MAG: 3-deoxy-8-phosphooctulonate synthase [Phycisphaerales bacterium]|nr:3-deoxy-8-phosphooctulonate synthase [Phycisphaerales bacterium]
MPIQSVPFGQFRIGPDHPMALIAGPCVIESRDHTLRLADAIAVICRRLELPFIFKASFDKANRSSIDSFRGPGLTDGLAILNEVRHETGVPVLSDIHSPEQAQPAGRVLDCIQIPAFLCRQTDLLLAAGRTGVAVNVKKGQFMSPDEMGNVVDKIRSTGNDRVLLTERGTFFGYNHLVTDITALPRMRQWAPVVFDATHSCQLPGGAGASSAGQPQFIPVLARAAAAAGCDALFLEVHDDPRNARSDAATVYPLDQLEKLLTTCRRIADAART